MIYFALPFLLNPLLKHIRLLNNYWFQKLKLNIYLFIKKILPSSPLNKLKFRPAKKSLLHLIVIRKLDDTSIIGSSGENFDRRVSYSRGDRWPNGRSDPAAW